MKRVLVLQHVFDCMVLSWGFVECKTCRMQSAECESPSKCRVLSLFGCVLRHPRRKRLSEDLQRLPRHAFIKDAFGFVDSIRICGGHTILVGGLEHEFYFSTILGMSSSQLTFIFFQRGRSTTNQIIINHHYPYNNHILPIY